MAILSTSRTVNAQVVKLITVRLTKFTVFNTGKMTGTPSNSNGIINVSVDTKSVHPEEN